MKLINYKDGIVSFRLPEDWKEEYYKDNEAAFYRDDPDSGTLKINLISLLQDDTTEGYTLTSESGMHVEEGFPLKEDIKYTEEDGDNRLVYSWKVTVPVNDTNRRVILFSYTILVQQENNPVIQQELNFVRNTILTAHYSKEERF